MRINLIFLTIVVISILGFILSRPVSEASKAELYVCSWLGSAECQGWLGERLSKEGDPIAGSIWYQKSATKGFIPAQISLGTLYLHGQIVPQDDAQAFYWYNQAIEQGARNTDLLLVYGNMLVSARGVKPSPIQGLSWVKQAAELGDPRAMTQLAYYFHSDDSLLKQVMPQNVSEAYMWLLVAKRLTAKQSPLYQEILAKEEVLEALLTSDQIKQIGLNAVLLEQKLMKNTIATAKPTPQEDN